MSTSCIFLFPLCIKKEEKVWSEIFRGGGGRGAGSEGSHGRLATLLVMPKVVWTVGWLISALKQNMCLANDSPWGQHGDHHRAGWRLDWKRTCVCATYTHIYICVHTYSFSYLSMLKRGFVKYGCRNAGVERGKQDASCPERQDKKTSEGWVCGSLRSGKKNIIMVQSTAKF